MKNTCFLTVSCALAALLTPAIASAAVRFPVEMPVDYCFDRGDCFFMTVTVEADGSFVDSDRDGGFWEANRRTRELRLTYEFGDGAMGIVFSGTWDGECFSGDMTDERVVVGDWTSCL